MKIPVGRERSVSEYMYVPHNDSSTSVAIQQVTTILYHFSLHLKGQTPVLCSTHTKKTIECLFKVHSDDHDDESHGDKRKGREKQTIYYGTSLEIVIIMSTLINKPITHS